MQPTLSSRILCITVLATVSLLFSITASSQAWTFRNGFGQNDAGTGFPDIGRAVCTDASGNVYITGKISDATIPNTVSFGGAALVSAGDDDGFVAKFNSSGVHQWSIRFGGTVQDEGGYGIVTDGTSVYITGEASGNITVGLSATVYPAPAAAGDGFIMKLDAATGATVSWVTRFGGGNQDRGQAICLDPSGNVYVSGFFRTRIANPTATFGSFAPTVQGNTTGYTSDLFAAALNSSGTFLWVSTGGAASSNDNIVGSGICYVPSLSEVIVTGNYRSATGVVGSTTATYATTVPVSLVVLTNASATTNEDFCLLEIASATGAFLSGSGVGAGDGNEAGLSIIYDAGTTDVYFAGYFSSSSTTFPGNAANTNPTATRDNILYGRYNPSTNAYTWVKDADNGTSTTAADVARAIASDGTGSILIAGNFRNTVTFPGGAALSASGVQADVFVAKINPSTGNATWATQGTGTSATADDIANGIATAAGSNAWITGQYASSITLAPLAALASQGGTEDILLAKLNDPPPAVVTSVTVPPGSTYGIGTQLNFTVNWSEAVSVTGTPYISIVIGANTRQAVYISGNSTTALLFRYVVACNDFDNNGISVSALNLNGGTIRNTAAPTVNAIFTLNNVGSTAAVNVNANAPVVNAPTVTQPTCALPTGTIVVNATGNGVLEYSINNGSSYQASNTFSGLAANSYDIIVRFTGFTCSTAYSSNPVVINAAPSITVNTPTVTQPTCATPTGTIVVNATGSGTLEYSIDGGANYFASNSFPGLSPNSYNIFVRLQSTPACVSSYSGNPVVINAATGCAVATTTTITSSVNPSCLNQAVTFTATVTSGGNPVTVGTVTFADGATILGTVPLDVNGQAAFTTSGLTAGPHTITATYNGTTGFSISTGNVVQTVNGAPTITCPANITQNNDANQCGAVVTYAATSSTSCGTTVGYSPASGSFFPVGTTTVTATATDAFGNTASCTFTVRVVDAQNPSITCPANITRNNDANQCGAVVTYAATASDNCPGVTVSYSPASGSFFPVGTTTVTATATDAAASRIAGREAFVGGNTASCTFTVTVVDAQNPSITCPANITRNNDANQCGAVVTYVATASDNCPGVSVGYSPASGSFFPVGTTTVTATATDAVGRTASCTFTVTVVDAQNPSITCPANITRNNDANQCGAVVTYAATASDNCPGVSVGYSPASGSFFPVGTTTVTATATDAVGRTASCTFTVTVVDAQNPTIGSCPANITVNNTTNQCGANVSFTTPTASDNCPGTTVVASPASGSFFPVGTTTVTATATDASGRTSTCTFTVTVVDAQNPTITCPANITVNNTTNQCGAFVTYTTPPASDNCPGTTVVGSPVSGSFFPLGTTTVTVTATDAAGRTATCTFTVTVVDTQGPTLTCPANVTVTITSGCSKKLTPPNPTVIDNCGLSKLTWCLTGATTGDSPTSGINYVGNRTFNAGVTTITYTATDIYGNISECSFTVSVLETVLPNITCPSNKTVGTDYGYCFWSHVNLGTPNVSDNCGVLCVTNNAPDTFQLGTTIVTWTVTDNSGNTRSCNQTIIVLDKQTPSVTCPANIYQDAGPACVTTVTAPNPDYYDNCTVAKLTWQMTGATTGSSPSTGINFVGTKNYNVGTTTITYTIKDAANNSWSCSFAVTITDKTRPTITCPANIVLPATAGLCNRSIAVPDPTYSDNCGVTKLTWYTSGATNISSPTSGINKVGTKTFNVGVTTVTYTAYDPWGNSKQCTFTVTVTDNQPPVVSCPADRTLCKVTNNTYSIPAMTRTDNCSVASTTYQVTGVTTRSGTGTNASGTFNLGLSTITWTVTDAAGNTASCSTNVNIVPAGGCRLVSEPGDGITPDTKAPSKGKLDMIVQDAKLGVTAHPNPTEYYFNVRVTSQSKETVEIRMYDGLGKVVQVKRGAPDQTYRFGDNVVAGIYFIEASQGKEKVVIKIVKL